MTRQNFLPNTPGWIRVPIDNTFVDIKVLYERRRRSVRVAAGKDHVILRIPSYCTTEEKQGYREWATQWVRDQWKKSARFRATYTRFDLETCRSFSTDDRIFSVRYTIEDRKQAIIRSKEDTFHLQLPQAWTAAGRSEVAYKLIHRQLGAVYQDRFHRRVGQFHRAHFSKPLVSVTLKNMSSKWGSCSHTGKLNFSTRLLFAPQHVQHYVIVHELCHLTHLNHSGAYWELVGQLDPGYQACEKWLRDKGHLCDLMFRQQHESASVQLSLPLPRS